jgi:radical SAM superfamily enzyme YgiQ (UPF0313 family)
MSTISDMKTKMILPALTEAKSPFFRPIKYSLFPPLGLATLAAYLPSDWEVEIVDEHIDEIRLDDEPDLVVIQVYITNAYRAYELADHYRAKGVYVCLGGLHVTSLPEEAAAHADTIFLGPGEDTWPQFLADFQTWFPKPVYVSRERSLEGKPAPRRDLIKRNLYLVPNSIVVSRGCPHRCDFCYKEAFFKGGKSFYTQRVDAALAAIEALPGKHLYFLDDHLFGNARFAEALFEGMRGMGRVWQAAATVNSVLRPGLLEKAAEAGLRSLFIGFETLHACNLQDQHKPQNLIGHGSTRISRIKNKAKISVDPRTNYEFAIMRLHDLDVMVNASFVFGMDHDDEDVFDRTVAWAVEQSLETATFHILTPYPSTALYEQIKTRKRLTSHNWDDYDTRHAVFQPANMSAQTLEAGYWGAYRDFYRWGSILKSARAKQKWQQGLRHLAYSGGWKKFEPFWDLVIKAKRVAAFIPLLETILSGTSRNPTSHSQAMKNTMFPVETQHAASLQKQ